MWACPSNVQRRQWQYCSRWYMSPNLPPCQVTIIIVAVCDTCRPTFLHAPKNANYVHYDHHHHEHLDYDHLNIITSSLSENLMRVRLFLLPVLMLTVMMIIMSILILTICQYHQFYSLLLSCFLLSCHVRVSEGEQRWLTDAKCYIFLKSSQQLWFKWEGSEVFQGGWPCQVWKEASFLFLLRYQVLYIFEILSANVTQWEGYQVL